MIDVRTNFKTHYGQDLTCRLCPEEDTQPHLLVCKEIINNLDASNITYEDAFKDIAKQEALARVYSTALRIRNTKIEEQNSKLLSN